jgi:adenine-specific DNA-methyltransferase
VAIRKRGNGKAGSSKGAKGTAEAYRHREAESLLRPDIGVQAQFKKRKPPVTYRFDSSLAPELQWDGRNPSREFGEWLLDTIGAAATLPAPHQFDKPRVFADATGREYATVSSLAEAIEQLRRLGKPFLNWRRRHETEFKAR